MNCDVCGAPIRGGSYIKRRWTWMHPECASLYDRAASEAGRVRQ